MTSFGFVVFVGLNPYFGLDPRMNDGVITGDEMRYWEYLILGAGILLFLLGVGASLIDAFAQRRQGWRLSILIFPPLAFLYVRLEMQGIIR